MSRLIQLLQKHKVQQQECSHNTNLVLIY
jgi:hypothetical protein